MLTSIIVIGISAAMFCYWFRYTCSLILSTQTGEENAGRMATANQLQFLSVERELATAKKETLERIHSSLDRDYRILSGLFQQRRQRGMVAVSPECLLLRADFQALSLWYVVCRHFSETASRKALEEMSQIVRHFATTFGERVAVANLT